MNKKMKKKEMDKVSWLSELYYEIGKQATDFRLTYSFQKDGINIFSKWRNYLECQDDAAFLEKADHREQLKNEIVLDYDGDTEKYSELIQDLKKDSIKFYAYSTKSGRAKHIHTFWRNLAHLRKSRREQVRELFIRKYGCDIALKNDKHVIAMMGEKHWKTGEVKELINKEEGINDADWLIEEIREEEVKSKRKQQAAGMMIDNYMNNVEEFYTKQPFFYDLNGLFWFWKGHRYEQVDEVEVMTLLDEKLGFMGQTVNSKLKSHYLEAFKRVGRKNIPADAPAKWIQFKDKAYSLNSKNMYNVEPNYFFTNPIPWEIGDTDETPTMDKLIVDWVGEKYKQTAYEIIAYCCYRGYPIHMIFCLIGGGRNGKSSFVNMLNKFLGEANISSTELDKLLESRFESFKLYKKLVCSMGETNFGVISKTSLIKTLTGQDTIGFEFKHKKPFDGYNYAKILICSNSLPPSEDTSEGFYRRWFILDFPNNFPEGKDVLCTIPIAEYSNLARKVCNILPKLLEDGKFSNQGTIEYRTKRYVMASNPLSFFLKAYCKKDYSSFLRYSELYMAYRKFLHVIKHRKIGVKEFNDVLALEGLEIVRTTKCVNGEYINGKFVEGLKFMNDMNGMHAFITSTLYRQKVVKSCISFITFINSLSENNSKQKESSEPLKVEELIGPYHGKCKVCGANPCHFYGLSHYFCSKACFEQYEAQEN